MTIASDIIGRRMPDFERYVRQGESLDDVDEYGFTPLIECAITKQPEIAKELLDRGVDINKADVTGRTALHWAVDNHDLDLCQLLLERGANPNAYTRAGLSVLVYPLLRRQDQLKRLLYQHGAKLDFALDFILGKLLGHRFELKGDVDIINAEDEFIELDYEGFILEFTVDVVQDSLRRFTSSYSTRHLRQVFPLIYEIMDAFKVAEQMLRLQKNIFMTTQAFKELDSLLKAPLLIFPAASQGHAFCFVRYRQWWAKIDRGENSLTEGSINLYEITNPKAFDRDFVLDLMYKKQSRRFFHHQINQRLGLTPLAQIPMSSQISGNCSWANVQAVIPVAYALQQMKGREGVDPSEALSLYKEWLQWDQDRALDEAIGRFYIVSDLRKASHAAMLGGVLFQACDYDNPHHMKWAEKILTILTLPDYRYILDSYLQEYCVKRLTRKGNNLLKILDDCGVNPNIGVNPIATGLKKRSDNE